MAQMIERRDTQKALYNAADLLRTLAQRACANGDPHDVWWLIGRVHTIEAIARQVEMRFPTHLDRAPT